MRRILVDGCFDPVHLGHIRYLKEAETFGEVIVHVALDAAIEAKGRKPFQTKREREMMFRALGFQVDYMDTLASALTYSHYSYLVKGYEWYGKLPVDVIAACEKQHTGIIYTMTEERHSSERLA